MARPVTVTISHDLGKEEARRRVADGFGDLKRHIAGGMLFRFEENWAGEDRLVFAARGFGQHVTGTIDVFPQHVRIEVVLPDLLAAIAEKIAGRVEKKGRLLLEKK
ncbi:polyhydroxyalkanoic acid system family protein [Amphiplicatus metriothermophilus]|uniref:Putative polyhydroxyalkanoic acid system protein (PHA_gran_rgn) n=1 Tax=Amphiplicatus metriothermophilus TaxID=1519374 RepID=A0A239PW41_9PROT|nr:polyhydroxyalkanoic acid system family protein [Amphiplicatus metriothermophilus]MBB5519598.1 hypothetical protein [Amphiplicatus metriothermophilus]SNT74162.1 Putative polyhydroxyalkanoic acid system protein (PHA_gran_rgn) [Amphiplicatus metriothermophilus]